MTAHSPIGASSCERWWNCPGSIVLSEQLPPPPTSEYAKEGTAAHELAERCINNNLRPIVGTVLPEVDGSTFTCTEEMADAINLYIDYIQAICDKEMAWDDLELEHRFTLQHLDIEAFGTADAVLAAGTNLYVIDLKYGKGVSVDIVGNKQLQYYALGAYRRNESAEIDTIHTAIVQPRVENPIKEATYSVDELLAFEKELDRAIKRVRGQSHKEPTLSAGPHCRWCTAKPICPEIKRHIESEALSVFGDIDVSSDLSDRRYPVPSNLSSEQIAHVLRNMDLLQDWAKSVADYAHQEMEKGVRIPGYKLVDRRSNRKWISERAVEDELHKEYGDKIYNTKLKSPAQMEKLVGKANASDLDHLWEKPDAGTKLAPIDDNREARNPEIVSVFKDVKAIGE